MEATLVNRIEEEEDRRSDSPWSEDSKNINFDDPLHQSEMFFVTEEMYQNRCDRETSIHPTPVVELRPSAITEFRTNLAETVDQVIDKLLGDDRLRAWRKQELAELKQCLVERTAKNSLGILSEVTGEFFQKLLHALDYVLLHPTCLAQCYQFRLVESITPTLNSYSITNAQGKHIAFEGIHNLQEIFLFRVCSSDMDSQELKCVVDAVSESRSKDIFLYKKHRTYYAGLTFVLGALLCVAFKSLFRRN